MSHLGIQTALIETLASATSPKTETKLLSPQKPLKHVSFGQVVVHIHHLVLGDNPGVSNGVPLQLDWKSDGKETYDLRKVKDEGHKITGKFTSAERFRIALKKQSKHAILKETKMVTKIQESRTKSQEDETTEVETFLAGRRKKPQPAPPKKKVLWWYHRR